MRRNSGHVLDTSSFALSEVRGFLYRLLNVGEYCFDRILVYVLLSRYFKQVSLAMELRQRAYDYVRKQVLQE